MKLPTLAPFVASLGLLACDVRFVELGVEAVGGSVSASGGTSSGTGGKVNSGTGGGTSGGHTATGGAPASGGQIGGSDNSSGGGIILTRGGFGDSMATYHDGKPDSGMLDETCTKRGGSAFFVYEAQECLAASACLETCEPSAPSPEIAYRPRAPGEEPRKVEGECRTVPEGAGERSGESFVVFPCDDQGECPPELVCVKSEVGEACFIKDILWTASCTDQYCIRGSHPPDQPPELCNQDVPCCAGFTCSTQQTCEPLDCASAGYRCDSASPGPGCCDGLVCDGGYCKAP